MNSGTLGAVFAGSYQSEVSGKTRVVVNGGNIGTLYGGQQITNNGVRIDVTGGTVNEIHLGNNHDKGGTYGTAVIDLENCTVGSIYGGGYATSSKMVGPVYINVHENVNLVGSIYPMGSVKINSNYITGAVTIRAYVTLDDPDKNVVSKQFGRVKYSSSQANKIFVNGVCLGTQTEYVTPTSEIAEKVVNVTVDSTRVTNIFLNGIPTIVVGDGNGHSYLYQAKTKDGTLDVYQKNADGTFKTDEKRRKNKQYCP